jgi:Pro-kumamolisin, activation domain/Divergent InlB B-repeat domain
MKNGLIRRLLVATCGALLLSTVFAQAAGLKMLTGHVPAMVARLNLQPLGTLSNSMRLNLTIGLPLHNQEALTNLLQQIYDPASPNYHRYLTPDQFTEMFGPTKDDVQKAVNFAQTNGLTVTAKSSSRLLLDVSGTVSDVEKAFHVKMRVYQHPTENRMFYAPDVEPSVQSDVPILNVSGLNNYTVPHPANLKINPLSGTNGTPGAGSGLGGTYMGSDFRAAYLPGASLNGTGQTIGLVQFDSGFYQSDITSYENLAGLPNVPVQPVLLDSYDGGPGIANDEVSLDIEMSISMAPGISKVLVFEGSDTDDILDAMASSNQVRQLSASWTYPIDATTETIFLKFAAQGQSFFNASGDDDAYLDGQEFPPTGDPNITVVGGTTLTTSGPGGAWVSEKVWNERTSNPNGGDWGSSGGISGNPIPSWQQGVSMSANGGSATFRNLPDVALTADNIFVVYGDGEEGDFGGTSCASPLWAGFAALVNQQAVASGSPTVGFLNPALYAIGKGSSYASDFHDIQTGDNTWPGSPSKYFAVSGYDLCTGWGTPNGNNLINDLTPKRKGFLTISVNPPSGSALVNVSTQQIFVTVNDVYGVTNATVTAAIAGITNVTFLNNGQSPDATAGDDIYSAAFLVPAATNPITMTVIASATNEVGVTNVINYLIIQPPPNDNFANATKVPSAGASYLANNRFATIETNEPAHDGDANRAASLWWAWTPVAGTNVLIDTIGSKIDNVLAVYTGNALMNLQPVIATNGNPAQYQPAHVSFNANGGTTYYIAVASVSSNSLGSLVLDITPGGQLDTNPPVVSVSGPQSGLTVYSPIINVFGAASDPSPNASGVSQVLVNVNGAATVASGTTSWTANAALQPELNIIKVSAVDAAGNFSSTQTVEVNYLVLGPVNDFFAEAIPLNGTSGTVSGNNTNGTKEAGEPDIAGNTGGKSVWWSFTPSADGVLTLNTTNSTFDTLLGLYTGTNIADLTTIAENDDAYSGAPGGFSFISQAVRANQTYHIAVDGYNGVSGVISLSYSFASATVYNLTAANTAGGTVQLTTTNGLGGVAVAPGQSGDFASGSSVTLTALPDTDNQFNNWSGGVSSSSNPLVVTVHSDLNLTANFAPTTFTDGFESGNLSQLPWTTAGDVPWFVQTSVVDHGQYAARSGVIGDSQTSSLILTTNFTVGAGSFDYKVSSEQGWDFLNFYVDGVLLQQWSGEAGWANYLFPLTAGTHTLEWSYVKDPSVSLGLDAAFIDDVNLPLAAPSSGTLLPPQLQLQISGGGFLMTVNGQTNQQYVIQTSTNLVDWQNFSTNIATGGVIQITLPANTTNRAQFYRAFAP